MDIIFAILCGLLRNTCYRNANNSEPSFSISKRRCLFRREVPRARCAAVVLPAPPLPTPSTGQLPSQAKPGHSHAVPINVVAASPGRRSLLRAVPALVPFLPSPSRTHSSSQPAQSHDQVISGLLLQYSRPAQPPATLSELGSPPAEPPAEPPAGMAEREARRCAEGDLLLAVCSATRWIAARSAYSLLNFMRLS